MQASSDIPGQTSVGITQNAEDVKRTFLHNWKVNEEVKKRRGAGEGNDGPPAAAATSLILTPSCAFQVCGKTMVIKEGLLAGESVTRNLWDVLAEKLLEDQVKNRMVQEVGSSLRFVVGAESCVVVDVRDVATGAMVRQGDSKTEVDATLEMSDEAFFLVCAGKLTAHRALMTGRMLVKGNMLSAMRSGPLFELLRPLRSKGHYKQGGGLERRGIPQARL